MAPEPVQRSMALPSSGKRAAARAGELQALPPRDVGTGLDRDGEVAEGDVPGHPGERLAAGDAGGRARSAWSALRRPPRAARRPPRRRPRIPPGPACRKAGTAPPIARVGPGPQSNIAPATRGPEPGSSSPSVSVASAPRTGSVCTGAWFGRNSVGMKAIRIAPTDHQNVWANAAATGSATAGGSLPVAPTTPAEPPGTLIPAAVEVAHDLALEHHREQRRGDRAADPGARCS